MNFRRIVFDDERTPSYLDGLRYIRSKDIEMRFVGFDSFETLRINYVSSSPLNDPITFLKEGISEIVSVLNKIESIENESLESIKKRVAKDDMFSDSFMSTMADVEANRIFNDETKNKELAVLVLKYEFYRFKIKLSDLGIEFVNKADKVQFVDFKINSTELPADIIKGYPAKWHALLYIIELRSNNQNPPTTLEGNFAKKEIIDIGNVRCRSGQSFYKSFYEYYNQREAAFKKIYSADWIDRIIEISNNDETIIKYLDNYR